MMPSLAPGNKMVLFFHRSSARVLPYLGVLITNLRRADLSHGSCPHWVVHPERLGTQ